MATVSIVLSRVAGAHGGGKSMPVCNAEPIAAEVITTSGTSALSSIVVPDASPDCVWTITAIDGTVWGKFGTGDPEASQGDQHPFFAGQPRDFRAVVGQQFAAIDA